MSALPLPQYLVKPHASDETFGTLRLTSHKGKPIWEINGDPQVAVMAKRLFPGSEGRGAGHAKFAANTRIFADLIWFLHRWPLEIEDQAAFDEAYSATCAYVAKRQAIAAHPVTHLPGPLFIGNLRVYQQEALDWLLTNRRTLLGDGMGLGKTVTAIAYLATAQKWPALIVAPPHLIRHWEHFLTRFLDVVPATSGTLFSQGKATFHVIRGTKDKELPDAHIYVIHYLLLRAWREKLRAMRIRVLVFDEVQDLRHTGTEKYSAASELSTLAEDAIGLSGTPIYNRGAEIHSVLGALEYHCLGDWDSFTREWCTGFGTDSVKDPDLLGTHLRREGLMLRRRKEDVQSHLPPKERIVEAVDSDKGLFAELIMEAVKLAKDAEGLKDHLARGRLERQALEASRRATGIAKAPAVAAFAKGMLEAEEPTLIFAHHHDVVDHLLAALKDHNPVAITGRQSSQEKWQAQEDFRTGKSNVCIISLRSATGLDGFQERARVVIFAELDWSPAIHSQAEDRAHRDGQQNPVLCYYLVSDSGTDPDVMEALGFKISQFVGLMGDDEETEEDKALSGQAASRHMQNVLAKLRGPGRLTASTLESDEAYERFRAALVVEQAPHAGPKAVVNDRRVGE